MTRLTRLATAALLLGPLLGCGRSGHSTYPAGGRVRFADGSPLTTGWVEFESRTLSPPLTARGAIQPDGTFRLGTYAVGDGAVEGPHRAIVSVPVSNEAADHPDGSQRVLDAKYGDFEKSGLEFEVARDGARNQFEIVVAP